MRYLVSALLLALLSGCGLGTSTGEASDSTGPSLEVESQAPQDAPAPEPTGDDTCAEVRAGIDAFNRGDFEETISRFESAIPLAEASAEQEPSRMAADLLEAVEYYAELSPEEYPEASVLSPEFERYKQITLRQCAGAGQIAPPDDPGVEV